MGTYGTIRNKLADAQMRRQCLYAADSRECAYLNRMTKDGDVLRPYPSMYVECQYWGSLNPVEKMLHVMRTLAIRHPNMVFAGISAACAWGLEHSFHLHSNDDRIMLASSGGTPRNGYCERIRRFYVPQHEIERACEISGVRVTTIERTLFDCGRLYEGRSALSFYDSALRQGMISREDLIAYCDEPHRARNQHQSRALARFANGLSENGGESFCYATMAEEGMMLPEQQAEFSDMHNAGQLYRVDYLWKLPDGRLIVGELDGQQKYVDVSMTNGRSVEGVVVRERNRQEALKAGGVTQIVRWFFADAVRRSPMIDKLTAAGVPCGTVSAPWIR